jgi:hypothetical protein
MDGNYLSDSFEFLEMDACFTNQNEMIFSASSLAHFVELFLVCDAGAVVKAI